MTIRAVRAEAERRSVATVERVDGLAKALTPAANAVGGCAICGRATRLTTVPVLPATYIAAYLVLNDLDSLYRRLPFRHAPLCSDHHDHFTALFVDASDPRWDVERLERRAEVLKGVLVDGLLVFGGVKALTIVEEFHTSVADLRSVKDSLERRNLGKTGSEAPTSTNVERL